MGAAASAIALRAQCCTNSLRDTGPVCCGVVLMFSRQRKKRRAERQRATSRFRPISPRLHARQVEEDPAPAHLRRVTVQALSFPIVRGLTILNPACWLSSPLPQSEQDCVTQPSVGPPGGKGATTLRWANVGE